MKIKRSLPDWLVGLIVTAFFIFITLTGTMDFTDGIEKKTFDFRAKIAAPSERNPDIEIVAITDDDLDVLGRFPWPRDILAKGIYNLALAGARVIAMNILFPEPEQSEGLRTVIDLRERYESLGLAQEGDALVFYRELSKAIDRLDNDRKLYEAMKEAGNVVLPVHFDEQSKARDQEVAPFMEKNAFHKIQGVEHEWALESVKWVDKVKPLLPSFAEATLGIGHLNLFPDLDGTVRDQIPVVGYVNKTFFPSFPMAIVKAYKGLSDDDIEVILGQGILLRMSPSSSILVPVRGFQMSTLINWNKGPDIAFHHTPFSKVYNNEIQTPLFRDKIVIIGPTAPGISAQYVTPISGQLPSVEVVANSVANILNNRFFSRPSWIGFVEFGVLILFGLFITLVLPRLNAGMGALTTFCLFIGYGITGMALFFNQDIWLRITPPILLLLIGYILIISKRFFITEKTKEKVEADSVETNKMLGLSFQQQGMLDLALEKFRKIPLDEEGAKENLYNLGLDFERKRQFSKALATYRLIIEDGTNFKDLDERIPRLKGAEATMIFGTGGGAHPGDIGATLLDMDTKPTLGRYEVSGELGRGAMGVVYKGEDPKIHRTVAIKTVRLSDFDDEIVDGMKERFFREAESAGLLTHPNIVTIYDAGEEHDLAYIAMEFLEGSDLEGLVKQGKLLPMKDALRIVAQVAEALSYAHSKGIVHRDIKPANIMQLTGTNSVKVTDFGIARITSSSKTKTGMVLGTPSYMSPEQVAGKKVDGRSDIFSLGVVLFELLTGEKPFKGDDMTSLMYHIAREPHTSPRSINPRIPKVIEKIIDKALEKDVEKRYQDASQLAEHLKKVLARLEEVQAKKIEQAQKA
jgi:serine/threonine-protein kinase